MCVFFKPHFQKNKMLDYFAEKLEHKKFFAFQKLASKNSIIAV